MATKKKTTKRAKPKGRPPALLAQGAQDELEADDPRLGRVMTLAWVEQSPEPWQPSQWETAAAYEAFSYYRALGPERSYVQAWKYYAGRRKLTGKSYSSTFRQWATDYFWAERCAAWDTQIFEVQNSAQDAALKHCQGQLISALPYLVSVAIERAVAGDTKLIMDLLDRTGVTLEAGKQKDAEQGFAAVLAAALGARGVAK